MRFLDVVAMSRLSDLLFWSFFRLVREMLMRRRRIRIPLPMQVMRLPRHRVLMSRF